MMNRVIIVILLVLICGNAIAQSGIEAISIIDTPDGGKKYSLSLQVLLLMTALTFLPAVVISMTSFTRIVIVLAILRQGMGTQQTPSNQILVGMSMFLTFFIMSPVINDVHNNALKPYFEKEIDMFQALEIAQKPVREFMFKQTRDDDLSLFADIANVPGFDSKDDVPFSLLLPAFITSELKTAFQIGFLVLIPFLVIDLVVASVLMSMGMVMLSPLIISLPFKIMLFVLVDGWALVIGTLVASFIS